MGPTRTTDERVAELFRPALPLEGTAQWMIGEVLLRELAGDDARRAAVWWRTLELRVRYDPLGALARLDGAPADRPTGAEPPDADRLRAEAALATGDFARARTLLDAHAARTAPAWQLARAQLAIADGRLDDAIDLAAAAAAATDDPEWKMLAVCWRGEACARAGRGDAVAAAREELKALGERGGISYLAADLHLAIAATPQRDQLQTLEWGRRADDAIARLCDGVADDAATLGPIPRHVHAAFRKHRAAPARLEAELLAVMGLQHRARRPGEAYATIHYAAELARRLTPGAPATRLADALAAYEDVLGPDGTAAQRAYLDERAAAFLRAARPPGGAA